MYIDTSGYTGDSSLDGLMIYGIDYNDGNLGIYFKNSKNELVLSFTSASSNYDTYRPPIINTVRYGIRAYIEFVLSELNDGMSIIYNAVIQPFAFNKINDVQDKIFNTPKIPVLYGGGEVINILDNEGFSDTSGQWPAKQAVNYSKLDVSIEKIPNIFQQPYSRIFTIPDIKRPDDSYYTIPYETFILPDETTGWDELTISYWFNIKHIIKNTRNIYIGYNGNTGILVSHNYGVNEVIHEEGDITDTIHAVIDANSYNCVIDGDPWEFMVIQIKYSGTLARTPMFTIQMLGGADHIGEKNITCGWVFAKGIHDIDKNLIYPCKKSFYESIMNKKIEDGAVTSVKIADKAVTTNKIADKSITLAKLGSDIVLDGSNTWLTGGILATCGDSITAGAGVPDRLSEEDPYYPLEYNTSADKKTFGYHIARMNRMRWCNYAISGSTLGDVYFNGQDRQGFARPNGRYTKMMDGLTHITLFFGVNDAAYGHVNKIEDWLLAEYEAKIYWPLQADLIGTIHSDGTPYCTQEQYRAVLDYSGSVGGSSYTGLDYFKKLYRSTKDSVDPTTYWGGYNIVLPYMIGKYPTAKILLMVPWTADTDIRQITRDAAMKYGLCYLDFNDLQEIYVRYETRSTGKINGIDVGKFRRNTLTADGQHPNEDGYLYMSAPISTRLMSI